MCHSHFLRWYSTITGTPTVFPKRWNSKTTNNQSGDFHQDVKPFSDSFKNEWKNYNNWL